MTTLYSKIQSNIYLIIAVIVIIATLTLHPRIQMLIFPSQRTAGLNNLIEESRQNKTIDTRQFWELREFIAPGAFEFKREGFSPTETTAALKSVDTDIHWSDNTLHFLTYESNSVHSAEFLIPSSLIKDVVKDITKNSTEILLQTETDLIYRMSDGRVKLMFIRPLEEMKETNGFFDFNGYDKERVKDKNWLSISIISP